MAQARTAARILVDQLIAQGVMHASRVPGESYLSVLDALIDSGIDLLTCSAEGGAAMMAEAHGKPTGSRGISDVQPVHGATRSGARRVGKDCGRTRRHRLSPLT